MGFGYDEGILYGRTEPGLHRPITGGEHMNILVINGSPKGGRSNTYQLTSAFLDGMKEHAQAVGQVLEIQEISVKQLDISPCLGCFSCWSKTPGTCCIQDDMQGVIEKRLWADIAIWSFPLYYYTVPGMLKNLIDRQLPMSLPFMEEGENPTGSGGHPSRYDMSGKKTVVISTCGFYTAEGNYDGVRSLFDHTCGKDGYTAVFCGQGELFRVPELSRRTGEYLGYVREAGKEYMAGAILPKTRQKLDQLLYPREIFESWADQSWGINRETGEKESDALIFTRQMAGLYRKESCHGREQVLEMCYTDVNECYQILMGKEGSQVVMDRSITATTRIETPLSLWRSIAAGEIRGDEALMKGLYKVKGDFNLMLHWDDYFGGSENHTEEEPKDRIHIPGRETNMSIMLIPWMAFWITAGISRYGGGLAGIDASALAPLIFFRHKKTFYDVLSGALVAAFSTMAILGVSARIAVPLSYLSFGIMWIGSCLGRIPLTAHYSMNRYQGEDALQNPLFIKTNRILTLAWGAVYLATPVWTYVLMGTKAKPYIGAVNSVVPAFMGFFTLWFQKWYPRKVAAGK